MWENNLTGEIWEHSQDLWSLFKWRLVSTGVCFSLLGFKRRLRLNWREGKQIYARM